MDNSNPLQREIILENYRNPENNFIPDNYTHSHELKNLSCGDEITVYLSIEGETLKKINYQTRSCAICTASASILSQALENESLGNVKNLNEAYVEEVIGAKLSISRVKCALLPLRAIQQAANLQTQVAHF